MTHEGRLTAANEDSATARVDIIYFPPAIWKNYLVNTTYEPPLVIIAYEEITSENITGARLKTFQLHLTCRWSNTRGRLMQLKKYD